MSEKKVADELRERTFGALLTDAVMTWPSALVIGLTIIAYFSGISLFAGMPSWLWLVIGGILEVIYVGVTMSDPQARQQALQRILENKFDPSDIRNIPARQRLQKALEYKRNIDLFVSKQEGAMRVALDDTSYQLNNLIEQIYLLGKAIDNFEANKLIERDRREAETRLRSLETRLKVETDPGVKAELEDALKTQKSLLEDLRKVSAQGKRMEIKMDNAVTHLSAFHTKLQQMAYTKQLDSTRSKRLADEIKGEVDELADIISTMEDVYSGGDYSDAASRLSEPLETDLSQVSDEDLVGRKSSKRS